MKITIQLVVNSPGRINEEKVSEYIEQLLLIGIADVKNTLKEPDFDSIVKEDIENIAQLEFDNIHIVDGL